MNGLIPEVHQTTLFDQPEGLALKPDGTLVVGFDNDFKRVDGSPDNLLTAISL